MAEGEAVGEEPVQGGGGQVTVVLARGGRWVGDELWVGDGAVTGNLFVGEGEEVSWGGGADGEGGFAGGLEVVGEAGNGGEDGVFAGVGVAHFLGDAVEEDGALLKLLF